MFTIKIEIPERAIAALEKLAEKGLAITEFMTTSDNSRIPSEEEKLVQQEQPEEPVTVEMVRARLAVLMQSGKQAEVKTLLQKYGGDKLTDIPREKFPDLLQEAGGLE